MIMIYVMVTCWVGYWAHMYGYSAVEGDSCKTSLSWVVVGNSKGWESGLNQCVAIPKCHRLD